MDIQVFPLESEDGSLGDTPERLLLEGGTVTFHVPDGHRMGLMALRKVVEEMCDEAWGPLEEEGEMSEWEVGDEDSE